MSEAQATVDHYATLGVAPKAEDVVIRAAYLALMRRYHPDKDGSPASSERAQAIIAAFAVLGDYKTRVRYDWARRRAAEELARPPERRLTRVHLTLIAASVALLLTVPLLLARPSQTDGDPPVPAIARPSDQSVQRSPQSGPAPSPRPRPAEQIAASAPVPNPQLDEAVQLNLVEDQAVTSRSPLKDVSFGIAEAPTAPATPVKRPQPQKTAKSQKPALAASDECSSARPGVDAALCRDKNLAALDRLGETYYGQSVRVGNATKRAALLTSRNGFLGRREACKSDICLRNEYLAHMREITAIVENKPSPQR